MAAVVAAAMFETAAVTTTVFAAIGGVGGDVLTAIGVDGGSLTVMSVDGDVSAMTGITGGAVEVAAAVVAFDVAGSTAVVVIGSLGTVASTVSAAVDFWYSSAEAVITPSLTGVISEALAVGAVDGVWGRERTADIGSDSRGCGISSSGCVICVDEVGGSGR